MKKVLIIVSIALISNYCSISILGQNHNSMLNQKEMVKQLVGSWQGDVTKDTTIIWKIGINGTVMECHYKYVINGKTSLEGSQHWIYDPGIDKFKISGDETGMGVFVLWFIAKNKYVMLPDDDISSPEKALYKIEGEFKSPDLFVQTTSAANKTPVSQPYKRLK